MVPPWLFPPAYSHADLWRRDGLHDLERRVCSVSVSGESLDESERIEIQIVVELRARHDGALRARQHATISVLPSGALLLENDVSVYTKSSISLARVGLRFRLPRPDASPRSAAAGLKAEWYGRGPHENYSDRKRSAFVQRNASSSVKLSEELTKGYVYPQSCGQRSDVRWLSLSSGLLFCGSSPLSFSLLPSSDEAIAAAAHPHELPADSSLHLNVDHAMMGVGGDVGWTQSVRNAYLVPDGTHRWALLLVPFMAGPPDLAAVLPDALMGRVRDAQLRERVHVPTSWSRRLRLNLLPASPVTQALVGISVLIVASLLLGAKIGMSCVDPDGGQEEYGLRYVDCLSVPDVLCKC